MKILMIAPQPFFSFRGTPFSVYYRTKILADMGHEIDILTYPMGFDVDINNVNIIRIPRLPFVYEVKIGPSITKLILDIPLFFKAIYLVVKNKYDVIHAHEESVFFCLLFKLILGTRYIYDMHSSLPQQLENFNYTGSNLIKRPFQMLEKLSVARASAVITICKELEEAVKAMGYSEKSELIENTLFFPVALSDRNNNINLRNILNIDNKKVILYTGTFEPYQGIDMYIDSINIVLKERKDLFFIFIGGNSEQVLAMRDKAEKLGLTAQTLFTGTLEPNIVKMFLKEADILVSPRVKGTNTPLKIYEYMASGVPIVATKLKTHTQELDEECAFLRNPEAKDFASGILECLRDRDEAIKKAEKAYFKYSQRYGEEVYKKRLQRIINIVSQ